MKRRQFAYSLAAGMEGGRISAPGDLATSNENLHNRRTGAKRLDIASNMGIDKIVRLIFALTLLGELGFGRSLTGTLSGRILDSSEAAVPDATVIVHSSSTNFSSSAASAGDGSYRFDSMPPGRYRITVRHQGFANGVQELSLKEGQEVHADLHIRPAELNESVTVTAEPGYVTSESSTATKLSTSWLNIPQDVQSVNRQILDEQADFQLGDAMHNVSGVSRTETGTTGYLGNQFIMRGFQLDTENSYLRDGLKFSGYSISDLADVEQIEVLKGPASVLYGRGQPGGVINLISKKPLDTPVVSLEFTGGNDSFARPAFDISGPLFTPELTYRLNASYQNDFSFIDLVSGHHFFIAPAILWKPTDRTTLLLTGEVLNSSAVSDYGIPAVGDRPAPVPLSSFYGEPFNHADSRPRQAGYLFHHNFSPQCSVENRFSYVQAGSNYFEVYPYSVAADGRTIIRSIDSFGFPEDNRYSQTEVVGALTTGPVQHQILVGFEAGWTNGYFLGPIVDAPSIDLFHPIYGGITRAQAFAELTPSNPSYFNFNIATRTHSVAGYIQDQIRLTRKLQLLIGCRFEEYYQTSQDSGSGTISRLANSANTPRAGIVYSISPAASLYFSYVRSFSPSDPTLVSKSGIPFQPQRAEQYEAGIKSALFGRHLDTTISLYRIKESNVLTADPADPRFSVQTGVQRSKGVDVDAVGKIRSGWNIWIAYEFDQAQVIRDNVFPIGAFLVEAPRHSGNIWTTYEIQHGVMRGLGFGAGLYVSSFKYGDLFNSYLLPGYARVDGSAYYSFHSSERTGWRFAVNVKNALDKNYFEASTGGFARAGAPRAIYSSVRFTWF